MINLSIAIAAALVAFLAGYQINPVAGYVPGVLVLVCGIFLFYAYVCYVAPWYFVHCPGFQDRYKFLLARWRPDIWYFGLFVLLRALLLTLVGVVLPDYAGLQVAAAVVILASAVTLSASYRPWRLRENLLADKGMGLAIIAIVALSWLRRGTPAGDR